MFPKAEICIASVREGKGKEAYFVERDTANGATTSMWNRVLRCHTATIRKLRDLQVNKDSKALGLMAGREKLHQTTFGSKFEISKSMTLEQNSITEFATPSSSDCDSYLF